MHPILNDLRVELIKLGNEKDRISAQRFFKETVSFHGVKTVGVKQCNHKYFVEVKKLSKDKAYQLFEELLESPFCEEQWIGTNWIYKYGQIEETDFSIFEKWIHALVNNWATCDTLCNHVMGEFLDKYPEYIKILKNKWTQSNNRWVKRAAAVSLIIPAKEGRFLKDVFEIADKLLFDKDDMVQKGYGWLLKEASRKHQQEVFDYVVKHKAVMPRTALRYAIEKMPQELKQKAMVKS